MDRRTSKFALVLALAFIPMLAACGSDTPETHLSWGVNDRLATRRAPVRTSALPPANGPRTYVYQEDGYEASPPVPTPRPAYRAASAIKQTPTYEYRDEPSRAAPAAGNASFAWPVSGEVIAGFGVARNGERNDGINIATRMNAPIRAAAGGTVNYADRLNGYGNLVLIKHSNGYVTAYAHADRLLVRSGDYVAKGQVIGYAGQTGDVSSPQVHFEIRNGTRPVDPERLLVARAGA
jgi:murein DD-endopeptidase MepM/ murein hydrolase activator NlpD